MSVATASTAVHPRPELALVRTPAPTEVPIPTTVPAQQPRRDPNRGCREVFTDFVQAHTPALMHSAYALTGSGPAAEELVQDTLVRLYPRWGAVQNADVPLAYVRRTLTNQFLNERRRTTNREVVTDDVPDRPVTRNTENDVVDRDEMVALLRTLGGRQRAALVLRYYEGLSDLEIAEALGSRPGTVRSLISRGLATLRQAAQAAA